MHFTCGPGRLPSRTVISGTVLLCSLALAGCHIVGPGHQTTSFSEPTAQIMFTNAGAGAVSLGEPDCHPASPVSPSALGPPEAQGTLTQGQLWMLFHAGLPHVDAGSSLILRMTGTGALQLAAVGPEGRRIIPTRVTQHAGSTWQRPGDEWDATFVFPESGCWRLQATRQATVGDVWLVVQP